MSKQEIKKDYSSQGIDLDQLESIGDGLDPEKQMLMEEFERKKSAKSLAVPTEDGKVKSRLRELGEPITLFAEKPGDRRERLRQLMASRPNMTFMDELSSDEEEEEEEEFYTYGSEALLSARKDIFTYSIPRAKERIRLQRNEQEIELAARKKQKFEWFNHLKTFETKALQFGDDRPLGYCRFSPNGQMLGTASFTGLVKIWSVPEAELKHTLRGHHERVSGFDFHPGSTLSQSSSCLNLVSGAFDGTVLLHSLDSEEPLGSLDGHELRVSRAVFHPSGRYIGTSSFDSTWRLWDAETRQELLLQEGHSRQLYGLAFQSDGSLVATGGMDHLSRVWDLRTGKSIMVLRGHVKSVLSLDWSPNGYHLATGSEDHTIRVWDIRTASPIYTVPAHTSIVTQVRYFHGGWSNDMETESIPRHVLNGSFLVSSSFDGTCKIWTDGDFKPLKSMTGLEGKISCCDISSDAQFIATTLHDRTFKLFSAAPELVK